MRKASRCHSADEASFRRGKLAKGGDWRKHQTPIASSRCQSRELAGNCIGKKRER